MKIIRKIIFCFEITADLPSFFRLIIHSKKLSRSKSRTIASHKENTYFPLKIRFRHLSQTIFLRTYKGDIDIFYEIFYKEIYALPLVNRDVKLIIDLGANVGLSAVYFKGVYPHARIICVEPGKENYQMLLKNIATSVVNGEAIALNAAIMGRDGEVSFEDGKMHFNGKIVEGGVKDTLAMGMSTLFQSSQIAHAQLVKIDIEGSENDVFEANVDWLAGVDNIIIEMHSEAIRDKCQAVLKENHFEIHQIVADPTNANLFWAVKS